MKFTADDYVIVCGDFRLCREYGGVSSLDIEGGVFERSDPDFRLKIKRARERGLPYRILGEFW